MKTTPKAKAAYETTANRICYVRHQAANTTVGFFVAGKLNWLNLKTDDFGRAKLRLADARAKIERARLAHSNAEAGTANLGELIDLYRTKLAQKIDLHPRYRAGFKTFESYCKDRWGFSPQYANRVISSASAVKQLPKDLETMVSNERAAREVAKIEPASRDEVVREAAAQAKSEDRKLTARDIAEAAPKKKREPAFEMPAMALAIARGAIGMLQRILKDDGEKSHPATCLRGLGQMPAGPRDHRP